MGLWLTILIIGYFFITILLVLVILMQSGKGGGLSGLAGATSLADAFGATGAEKTLKRWTTYLATAFFILSIGLTLIGSSVFKRTSLLQQLEQEAKVEQSRTLSEVSTTPASAIDTVTSPSQQQSSSSATEEGLKVESTQITSPGEKTDKSEPANSDLTPAATGESSSN
ncbi:MAG: preprotein translocase subunit SecG [Candidatus Sumerlaeia bacterium]|nr:preprotein translocase subunit SecG [Candidatus Sumerlaeia bacterium]